MSGSAGSVDYQHAKNGDGEMSTRVEQPLDDMLTVVGMEWFDRVNGNSYCAVRVYWNGHLIATAPFTLGYGDFYKHAAQEVLGDWLPPDTVNKYDNGMDLPLWQVAINGGFKLDTRLVENQTRHMVEEWGAVG